VLGQGRNRSPTSSRKMRLMNMYFVMAIGYGCVLLERPPSWDIVAAAIVEGCGGVEKISNNHPHAVFLGGPDECPEISRRKNFAGRIRRRVRCLARKLQFG